MQRHLPRRLIQGALLLVVLALIVFALARVTGDPADLLLLPEDATREDRAHLLQALGLDRPAHEQLGIFLAGALRGDLGQSIGVFFTLLVTGAIVTETVFAWPGVGRLTYEAVIFRDYPLLQAVILLKAIIVLGVNLGVDVLYAYLDPRVRYT